MTHFLKCSFTSLIRKSVANIEAIHPEKKKHRIWTMALEKKVKKLRRSLFANHMQYVSYPLPLNNQHLYLNSLNCSYCFYDLKGTMNEREANVRKQTMQNFNQNTSSTISGMFVSSFGFTVLHSSMFVCCRVFFILYFTQLQYPYCRSKLTFW